MDEISNLIKEAKPLYFKRKIRAKRIKTAMFSVFLIASFVFSGFLGYGIKTNEVTASSGDENYLASYYPVDDYGLITVQY